MFIRNIHRNMRMNQFRGNLRCETEEHTELLQTKEEGTNQNSKTASNTRLKRIAIQLETSRTENMSEEVHRDRHQNGASALRSSSSADTDLDKKCENILFFCSFIFGTLNFKTLVTYISFIFNFLTTTLLILTIMFYIFRRRLKVPSDCCMLVLCCLLI